jgi:hypothetical protein
VRTRGSNADPEEIENTYGHTALLYRPCADRQKTGAKIARPAMAIAAVRVLPILPLRAFSGTPADAWLVGLQA